MRQMMCFLGVATVVFVMVGCGDKLPGTYVGGLDVNQSASVTLSPPGGAPEVRRFSGGQHSDDATVSVRESSEGYSVEMPGCSFSAVRDRDQNGFRIAPEQSCRVDLDGHSVEFTLSGSGRLASANSLELTIDGAAATPNSAGGVSWTFSGGKR